MVLCNSQKVATVYLLSPRCDFNPTVSPVAVVAFCSVAERLLPASMSTILHMAVSGILLESHSQHFCPQGFLPSIALRHRNRSSQWQHLRWTPAHGRRALLHPGPTPSPLLLFLHALGYLRNTRDSFCYLLQHQGKYGSYPPLPGFSQMSEEPVSWRAIFFLKKLNKTDPFLQENT